MLGADYGDLRLLEMHNIVGFRTNAEASVNAENYHSRVCVVSDFCQNGCGFVKERLRFCAQY